MIDLKSKKHYIAVIGGSISGSEAANVLASKGFRVVVFEMNNLPYGKIEDGLPCWHIGLRDKQEKNIDAKLDHENILFVPKVQIGKDIPFRELVEDWGFTAVILANGAWKDRELPIRNIEKFRGKELIYQNSLLYWFNHKHEPDYNGKTYEMEDGAVVVGGGLASLDVMKIGMIELVQKALKEKKGLDYNMFELEKKGIDKILRENNTSLEDLGLKGMTLVYRRNAKDMPLKSVKDNSPESKRKAEEVSEKLLNKYVEKYLFQFLPLHIPSDYIEHNCSLKGVVFQKVEIKDGRLIPVEESETLQTHQIISSIGSLPKKIEGLPYERDWLMMKKDVDYMVEGFDHVFAVGNAVTGKGNIQESKIHGRKITEKIIEEQLVDIDLLEEWLKSMNKNITDETRKEVDSIENFIKDKEIQSDETIAAILEKIKTFQDKAGYTGYKEWIASKTPVRLENMLSKL
jgi:NADPH-dependent glutamate synthase beta subunit-like oxidoreductase